MDIKAKVEEILEKVKDDKEFKEEFKESPVKALENLLGVDLPDEQMKALVEGVKAKLNMEKAKGVVHDIEGKLGGLFHKD